jgi:hypothetical protein
VVCIYHGIQQQLGVQHRTVNHSLNFVDPGTGIHTQHIESYWSKCKGRFKAMHGTTVIWTSSCGETDSAGHTKIASTTSKDTSPNSISVETSPHFQSLALKGPPILLKKKLNYVLLCFIKLQFKPKCHGIDTIMYNSLIPFANFGSSQYSILKLIAIHNLACSYIISAVHNIRGKSSVMSKYFVWSLRVWYIY